MRLVVLMKPIHDPLVPMSEAELSALEKGQPEAHLAFGPYDENALEMALQIADHMPDGAVTVLSLCATEEETLFRSALAAGAAEAIVVKSLCAWRLSAIQVAQALTDAIQALDDVAAVLGGAQSGDWDSGLVPLAVATQLGWPFVSRVTEGNQVAGGQVQLTSRGESGPIRCRVDFPWVGSVLSGGSNSLRYPTIRDRFAAKRKPLRVIEGGHPEPHAAVRLTLAPQQMRETTYIQGPGDEEKGRALLRELRLRGVV